MKVEKGGSKKRPPQPVLAPLLVAAAAAAVLVVVALRLHLAGWPLERDEGEYAYGGQLLLRGGALYRDLYTLKFPGAHLFYAGVLAVLGESARAIRLGLLAVNLSTAGLLFFLGRRLLGPAAGVAGAAAFVLLSASLSVLGPFAHATQILVLPMTGGMLALLSARDRARPLPWLFLAGLLLGLSVLVKQHAAAVVLFAVPWTVVEARRSGRGGREAALAVASLLAGTALPLLVLAGTLLYAGVIESFWFWCFRYARAYLAVPTLPEGLASLWLRIASLTRSSPVLVGLALLGAVAVLRRQGRERLFLAGWLLACLAAAAPGFYFREHYLVPLLCPLALLAGAGAAALAGSGRAIFPAALLLAAAVYPLWWHGGILLERDAGKAMHRLLGANPFPEALEIGRHLRREARPGDRLAVLGSEPEILFHAGIPSATGYLYAYGMMEPQPYARGMQDDLIRRLEAAPPRFLVFVGEPMSWLPWPSSETRLLEWASRFIPAHYDPIGVVEMVSREQARFVWGDAARGRKPQSPSYLMVVRRRPDRGFPDRRPGS